MEMLGGIIGRLIPLLLVEMLARSAAFFVQIIRPRYASPLENRIRGRYWGLLVKGRRLKIGRNVKFENHAHIRLGDNVTLFDAVQVIAGSAGFVHIGKNSHVSRSSILAGGGGIKIGEGCMISANISIYSVQNDLQAPEGSQQRSQKMAVTIGDDVFIGAGAVILPGMSIGDGAVIGAGAVVTKPVPAKHRAVGVPAKIVPLS